MKLTLRTIALVVRDYDEAIAYYTETLGFTLLEDTQLDAQKRWVVVSPGGADPAGARLLLARAANDAQRAHIGNQTGGRVFLFLHTDDFDAYFERLQEKQVEIVRPPSVEAYGKVAVFRDLYGNLWDLIDLKI